MMRPDPPGKKSNKNWQTRKNSEKASKMDNKNHMSLNFHQNGVTGPVKKRGLSGISRQIIEFQISEDSMPYEYKQRNRFQTSYK